MRLHVFPNITSRDGVSNKGARLTNAIVAENDKGAQITELRPGLSAISTASGNGNGLASFNNVLISVYGVNACFGTTPTGISAVVDNKFDFCASPL